ncbi:MAG: flavoprotein [Anaerolineae bacterium]
MSESPTLAYLVVTGSVYAFRVPELIAGLSGLGLRVLTLLTPGARQVISPRELVRVAGHRLVESYFDAALLPRPEPGLVLVAPCTFNTLNKLAQGIADSLPLSLTSEAIGHGGPVLVAPSLNPGLWQHPRTASSLVTLRGWGITIVEPEPMEHGLAPTATILDAVRARLAG